MVSIKLFITVSMMIGNIIDIYLSGIMIVLINWLMYSSNFGLILGSYLLYLFLTRMELFLIITGSINSELIQRLPNAPTPILAEIRPVNPPKLELKGKPIIEYPAVRGK